MDKSDKLSVFTIEKIPDAVVWVDSEAQIYYVNEAASKLIGYSREECIGKKAYEFTIDDSEMMWRYRWEKLIEKKVMTFEKHQATKNGQLIPIEVKQNLIEFEGVQYSCSVFRDISEKKRSEDNLKKALKKVEQLKGQLEEENQYLQQEIKLTHNFDEIISKGNKLKKVLNNVEQVSNTDATVLIYGETGTGKELFARAIHSLSKRCHRPLVKVNCAALPSELIMTELFGHEKGAFTGALTQKKGRFELADGGTIFLDEIGDMPMELQPKLLRILQEKEFQRLGSSTTIKTDVRVITATNKNIKKLIAKGDFREDLYYRLNVFPIHIPPLRERIEDIPVLVNHFVSKYIKKTGKTIRKIPSNAIENLQKYHWPGNVRELENIIERAVILSRGNCLELSNWFSEEVSSACSSFSTIDEVLKAHILKVLEQMRWRISGDKGAAKVLNINPKTLETKMKKLGINRYG